MNREPTMSKPRTRWAIDVFVVKIAIARSDEASPFTHFMYERHSFPAVYLSRKTESNPTSVLRTDNSHSLGILQLCFFREPTTPFLTPATAAFATNMFISALALVAVFAGTGAQADLGYVRG